jgi:hypothetical protein
MQDGPPKWISGARLCVGMAALNPLIQQPLNDPMPSSPLQEKRSTPVEN